MPKDLKHIGPLVSVESLDLPPTRIRHRADKISPNGDVSALCFKSPRSIDMSVATWAWNDAAVTCPKCLAILRWRDNEKLSQVMDWDDWKPSKDIT